MAGFLRKKSKSRQQEPVVISSPFNIAPTPIFAKLATSSNSPEQQSRHAPLKTPSQGRIVVSQPKALGSINRGTTLNGVPRRVETQGAPRSGTQTISSSAANAGVRNSTYNHDFTVMAAQSARFPTVNGTLSPQQQANRNVARYPAIDKPLPIPIPTEDEPSPSDVSNVPPVEPTPLLSRRPVPQSGLQTSFHGARAELVQAGMNIEQRTIGEASASSQEKRPPKPVPKDVAPPSLPYTGDSIHRSVSASVSEQRLPSASRQERSLLARSFAAQSSPPSDQEPALRRLTDDVVQEPSINGISNQLPLPPVQQPVVRHPINGVVQLPSSRSQNSTSPRPERREVEPPGLLSADLTVKPLPPTGNLQAFAVRREVEPPGLLSADPTAKPLPPAGNLQAYAKQLNGGPPFPIAATVNGPTVASDRLRKDATTVKPVLTMRGDWSPPSSQRDLDQNPALVITNGTSLGGTYHNGSGVRDNIKGNRLLPSRPKSSSEPSDEDDLFVDATEEPKQATTPSLGVRRLPPESSPYRNRSSLASSSAPNSGDPSETVRNQPTLVSEPPPHQSRDVAPVSRVIDNIGANISFPEKQDSPSESNMFKTGQRRTHLPSSPSEGLKMRDMNQTMSLHQQLDPYRMLQPTANGGPTRGKPLIFAAMEANIDRPQPGEEQRVSVRLWDGQDRSLGQTVTGYPSPPSSTTTDQPRSPTPANNSPRDAAAAEYPSPPSSEFAFPRVVVEGHRESRHSTHVSTAVSGRPRKLSKARQPSDDGHKLFQRPVTPAKGRPLTPVSQTLKKAATSPEKSELQVPSSRQTLRSSGMSLLDVDEDPFAKIEGVKMLAPVAKEKEKIQERDIGARKTKVRNGEMSEDSPEETDVRLKKQHSIPSIPSIETDSDCIGASLANSVKADTKSEKSSKYAKKRIPRAEESEAVVKSDATALSKSFEKNVGKAHPKSDVESLGTDIVEGVLLAKHGRQRSRSLAGLWEFVSDARLLSELLSYLSFYDWCLLAGVSKHIRTLLSESDDLKEATLQRFLKTVGYAKWCWDGPDPLPLSLQDLNDYMFGVSTPTHEYARVANLHVKSLALHPSQRDPLIGVMVHRLTAATRAYSRVVLRLRAQAEKDAESRVSHHPAKSVYSRPQSRASSPHSAFSHGHSHHGHGNLHQLNGSPSNTGFKSPLFRLKRAPLLRVFVPSPDGEWLSNESLLECEEECRRAGIMKLLRFGDVVWDVAVGDEGNVGRLVWDGSYLIDLDYSYSPVGDLPKYIPSLAFPPSYFHKVIRTGPGYSNPIIHIDLRPWGEQVATNLQLLQDRIRTETPQGAFHNVVRWVHRSSLVIRPPPNSVRIVGSPISLDRQNRIHIPDTNKLFVDPGWYGTVVVETEGTNESLADLQDRCGPGVFPPRAIGVAGQMGINPPADARKVFRVLREKSRPGEIWVKAVGIKEKLP